MRYGSVGIESSNIAILDDPNMHGYILYFDDRLIFHFPHPEAYNINLGLTCSK